MVDDTIEGSNTPVAEGTAVTLKDGKMFLGERPVVLEADLMGAKKGAEGKYTQLEEAHTTAINAATLKQAETDRANAALTAEVTKLRTEADAAKAAQSAGNPGAGAGDPAPAGTGTTPVVAGETTTPQPAAAGASASGAPAEPSATEKAAVAQSIVLKKELLTAKYGIPADKMPENATLATLEALETAAAALAQARTGGVGPYALGQGTGDATPKTNMDRARAVMEAQTAVRK